MANADLLWSKLEKSWPEDVEWLTIDQVEKMIPRGTAGVTIPASYDFAMLTLLSNARRSFLKHENRDAKRMIDIEIVKTNRNNGLWKVYRTSRVKRSY